MKSLLSTIIVALVLLTILLIYNLMNTLNCINNVNIKNYINGYWTSDNKFSKLSDIDEMIIYFDLEKNNGYLIIINDNNIAINSEFDILLNDKFEYTYKDVNNNLLFNVEFKSDDNDFIWDNKIFNCILSINSGSLKVFHEDTIYADLFKDNKITYYLNE